MNNKNLLWLFFSLLLLKITAIYLTSFNLFGDEAQYWLWSKNLDVGYYSKPPFLAWSIWIYAGFFGDTFFSLKLFPPLIYLLIGFSFYNLCKNIGLNKEESVSLTLVFLFIPAVSFSSFIISTDIFLLLFWILALNELIKIRKNPSKIKFILLGVIIGLAFLSKYAAIYFLLCFVLYVFLDKQFRLFVQKNYFGLILCIISIILVVLPNIIWNLKNDWITLKHTSDNANFDNINLSVFRGLVFLGIQALMVGPFLVFTNIINYKYINIDENKKLLLVFSIPIFIIVFVEAVLSRANANWAAPALISFFLYLYLNIRGLKSVFIKLNIFFNYLFCFIFFSMIGLSYQSSIFSRISGMSDFAKNTYVYSQKNGIDHYVVSDRLLFASLSYELRNKKVYFYMPHDKSDRITNHFKISSALNELMLEDFILIGKIDDIKYLKNKFKFNKNIILGESIKDKINMVEVYEVRFD